MSKRPTFAEMKEKALSDPKVAAEYQALGPMFDMKRKMIRMRKTAGMSQAQMAELLGTKKSNISRLESMDYASSPRLATVEDYARALGYELHVDFKRRA